MSTSDVREGGGLGMEAVHALDIAAMALRHREEMEAFLEDQETVTEERQREMMRQRMDTPFEDLALWDHVQGQEADEQWRALEEEKQTVENNHQREKDALLANQRAEAAVGDGSIGSGRMSQ